MPRRRHDSDSDDSDVSPGRRKQQNVKGKSPKGSKRAESDSSDEDNRSKGNKSKRRDSFSETEPSPVKKSIASKVEKAKEKDKSKKGKKGNKRQGEGEESILDKKKARGDQGFHQQDERARRGNTQDSGANKQKSGRGQRSPIKGRRKPQEEQTLGQFLDSPPRRRDSVEGDQRGFDERDRGFGNRRDSRRRSFDRPGERRFSGSDREGFRSRSPQDRWNRSRNDSWREDDRSNVRMRGSLSPNARKRMNRSMSPNRKNVDLASPPSSRRALVERQRSPSVEKLKSSSQGRKKKSKKKGNNSNMFASDSDFQSPVKESSVSSKKSSKKKRDDSIERSFERSKLSLSEENLHSRTLDDLDRHIESPVKSKKNKSKRQKHSSDSESISPDRSKKSEKTKSGRKDGGKTSKKGKKSKTAKNNISGDMLSQGMEQMEDEVSRRSGSKRKSNSFRQESVSRSPSPHNGSVRSAELNRSRSSDFNRSYSRDEMVGRNHDMTKFESEPESGEITDSDEEAEKGRQALKSQIKKPTEEELQKIEDERYWEEKRRGSRRGEESNNRREEKRGRDRGSKRRQEETKDPEPPAPEAASPAPKKPKTQDGGVAALTGRTGGAYIPPARLRAMQASITDKSSVEYQRISWEALKKSINGLINKVNVSNIEDIVRELFQENIVRGRGLMARSIIQAQSASPTFTHVFAALVAVVNTKFPQNGELILKRLVQLFRRAYRRNDKNVCLSATRFIAHLVNQQVAHEVLSLEILTLLLEEPTDDSVEVAVGFLKECGQKLSEVTPRGINAIFERLRNVLHEGQIDIRVQYMVEVMFAVRKDGFKDNPAVMEDLDLVEEEDQFTHMMTLDDVTDGEELLNVFRPDPNFLDNEEKYKVLKTEILGASSDEEGSGSGSDSSGDSEEDSDNEEEGEAKQTIVDSTETNMVALRRIIYLTIQSSLDFEECAHKLMKMELKPGQEVELCNMILDCCAQMRTYEKFFGLLAGRFCMLDKKYVEPFQQMFQEQYSTIHRLETNKLRNVAKFFAHLLHTDSLSWAVLSCIKLNEDDTTSASRIFIKILFQELSEYLGLPKLNERLKDPTLQEYYAGLMPRDNPRDTRFAINFFTTIGLGGLTDDLREHLKSISKKLMEQKQEQQTAGADTDSDSSDSSSDDSSESSSEASSSESDSSDSDSSEDDRRKKKKGRVDKKKETEKKKKGRSRSEQEINRDRRGRQDRDRSNGAIEKADRKKDKKSKKGKQSVDDQKQREEQFRRLAKLANYGDVINETERRDRQKKSVELDDRRERRSGRGRSSERDHFEGEGRRRDLDRDVIDPRDRLADPRDRGAFERRGHSEKSYDGLSSREDRDSRRGRKGRDFIDDERDRPVQIERNFSRMDIFEDKFAREREMNLEYLRGSREFEDYFRGRGDVSRDGMERGEIRGPRGRSREWDERRAGPPFGDRDLDRGMDEGRRRGRNRSEERVPAGREERRRRR